MGLDHYYQPILLDILNKVKSTGIFDILSKYEIIKYYNLYDEKGYITKEIKYLYYEVIKPIAISKFITFSKGDNIDKNCLEFYDIDNINSYIENNKHLLNSGSVKIWNVTLPDDAIYKKTDTDLYITDKMNLTYVGFINDPYIMNLHPSLSKLAVKIHSSNLEYIIKKTYELYKQAIEYDGTSLKYIKNEDKTYELCKLAVQNNSNALLFVPDKYFLEPYGKELCNIAIKSDTTPLLCLIKKYNNIKLEFNKNVI
jgi:hypothetical protein